MIEAIDGEAINGQYRLMRCSDGRQLLSSKELKTQQIFEWLAANPTGRYCCFGSNYDVNQWLKDLPEQHLKRLWETNAVIWNGWRIEWLPTKFFSAKRSVKNGFRVEESWGFFQKPFIGALEEWAIDCPDVIAWGKRERIDFKDNDIPEAAAYCLAECEALRDLMAKLRARAKSVGIEPRWWIGPGALASELFKRESIGDHHRYERNFSNWRQIGGPILCAYFGGRVEAYEQRAYQRAYAYDISSAYPHAMLSLPSLAYATVKKEGYRRNAKHGIYRARWNVCTRIAPFPVRQGTSIYYPAAGEGWYHASEIKAALGLWPKEIEILDGWRLVTGARQHIYPFAYIPALYAERVKLLANGDLSGQLLKLAMNASYGKLAQSRSAGRTPRWRQLWWAGEITAMTRARILDLLALRGRHGMFLEPPLSISTDGLVFDSPLPVITTKGELGGWERSDYRQFELLAPGVYSYTLDKQRRYKTRGFFLKDVDWEQLSKDVFEDRVYKYPSRRFIGLGAALMRKDMRIWRTWEQSDRSLYCRIDRRELHGSCSWPLSGPMVSEPYRPADPSLYAEVADEMDQPNFYRD